MHISSAVVECMVSILSGEDFQEIEGGSIPMIFLMSLVFCKIILIVIVIVIFIAYQQGYPF